MSRAIEEYGTHTEVVMKQAIKAMKAGEKDLHKELHGVSDYLRRLFNALEDIKVQEQRQVKRNPKQYLGYFSVTSGEVMISDPCYSIDTWCNEKVSNVKNGEWMAVKVSSDEEDWGIRVGQLYAFTGNEPKEEDFKHVESANIGVDSGQAGIFDMLAYRNDSNVNLADIQSALWRNKGGEDGEKWYGLCCDITSSQQSAGVITGGVVSSSGYGDGGYNLYTVEDKDGLITAIKVVYIGDEEEEEDEE